MFLTGENLARRKKRVKRIANVPGCILLLAESLLASKNLFINLVLSLEANEYRPEQDQSDI